MEREYQQDPATGQWRWQTGHEDIPLSDLTVTSTAGGIFQVKLTVYLTD